MAAEQQLDRSVLQRKEREELRAIAQAMSLETNSRTKKADIIDQILNAAANGVAPGEAGGASPRPAESSTSTNGSPRSSSNGSADGTSYAGNGLQEGPEGDLSSGTRSSGDGLESGSPAGDAPDASGNGTGALAGAASETESGAEPAGTGSAGTGSSASGESASDGPTADTPASDAPAQPAAREARHQTAQPGNRQGGAGQGEQGSRRNRRRRGRDRSGAPAERDLQPGGQEAQYQGELVTVSGVLDQRDEGFGFLRADGYLPGPRDVYVSISQVKRFSLRKGDYVEGACRPAASNEKFPALIRIDSVSGMSPDEARNRPRFEDLTPLFPDSKLRLESPGSTDNVTARIIDLLSPIGKGQRGLIVSPPKAGKTTVMKQIAHSIETNNPEVCLFVLLVDERPEEVTDMRRSVQGEVVASTFDRPSEEHTQVAELVIERAKRLVEQGRDVVVILDGITRLARAYNLAQPTSGRIMSGGVDSGALYPPKKFFGAARNIEEGGSLTILATALVETGSKMDEVIFEEFKGTGNMELRLDRRLSERRLYPSIDVNASSTRHEELLFERGQLQQVWKLRRVLNALAAEGNAAPGLELLMDKIRQTKSNDEFLAEIAKGPAPAV